MTRSVVFAVPGDLATPTGGYVYDRRIIGGLRALGWRVDVLDLGSRFPDPAEDTLQSADRLLSEAPQDRPIVVDGLALGVLPQTAAALRRSHRIVALVHHPLAYESGLSDGRRAALLASERQALSHVRSIIVTSTATKDLVAAHYGCPASAIFVVRPGNDRVPHAVGAGGKTIALLAVGSIVPRKGYDVLVHALAMLKDLPWTLTIVGSRDRDGAEARKLDSEIGRLDLGDRIQLTDTLSDGALAETYRQTDIFVLASRFEGYGMALADAIAYGLPVVATKAGAIPEAVPCEASILVAPDDAAALASALRTAIGDKAVRDKLAENARRFAAQLPQWSNQARLFAGVLETVQ